MSRATQAVLSVEPFSDSTSENPSPYASLPHHETRFAFLSRIAASSCAGMMAATRMSALDPRRRFRAELGSVQQDGADDAPVEQALLDDLPPRFDDARLGGRTADVPAFAEEDQVRARNDVRRVLRELEVRRVFAQQRLADVAALGHGVRPIADDVAQSAELSVLEFGAVAGDPDVRMLRLQEGIGRKAVFPAQVAERLHRDLDADADGDEIAGEERPVGKTDAAVGAFRDFGVIADLDARGFERGLDRRSDLLAQHRSPEARAAVQDRRLGAFRHRDGGELEADEARTDDREARLRTDGVRGDARVLVGLQAEDARVAAGHVPGPRGAADRDHELAVRDLLAAVERRDAPPVVDTRHGPPEQLLDPLFGVEFLFLQKDPVRRDLALHGVRQEDAGIQRMRLLGDDQDLAGTAAGPVGLGRRGSSHAAADDEDFDFAHAYAVILSVAKNLFPNNRSFTAFRMTRSYGYT